MDVVVVLTMCHVIPSFPHFTHQINQPALGMLFLDEYLGHLVLWQDIIERACWQEVAGPAYSPKHSAHATLAGNGWIGVLAGSCWHCGLWQALATHACWQEVVGQSCGQEVAGHTC